MRKAVLVGVAATALVAGGCSRGRAADGGPTVQKSYQVGAFQKIEVAGPYEVEVRTGSGPSVSATGPQGLIDRMTVEVKGDKLVIEPEHHGFFTWFHNNGTARIAVTVPSLTAAIIAGSGDIIVDKVQGDSFEGAVAGSGDLTLNALQVQQLKLSIAGSGDLRARGGQAHTAEYSIAGSGDLDASGVRSQVASAKIMGSGSIKGQATVSGDVTVMGSGDVELTGGAKCTVTRHGSGDVNCS